MSITIKAHFMALIVILSELKWIIYLRKVSVSNLTFIAFLSSEGVAAEAAACVDVTLLGHRADHTATTLLQTQRHSVIC